MNADERRAARVNAAAWDIDAAQPCRVCGYARINVRHETNPATAPEGPKYYAGMTDLHEFVP